MAKYTRFINDEEWKLLKPLLPESKASPKGSRPPRDNRHPLKSYYRFCAPEQGGKIYRIDTLTSPHA